MKDLSLGRLAWRHLWARPLQTLLHLLLLGLGLGSITLVILVSEQVQQSVQRELTGIDLVVGAKGSPLQLILAGVFHLDAPTGNIPLAAEQTLREHPLVSRVIPMALGDSVQGYRIVGTTLDYPALHGGQLAAGSWWQAPLQVVLGAEVAQATALGVGATLVGSHGLGGGEGSQPHGDTPYRVVGILARTGGVLDRLVLTAVDSVWAVHEGAHHGQGQSAEDAQAPDAERELTLLLVAYRSPLAAASLPRWVNAQPALQAASPALESARLMRLVGVGTDVLRGFGALLLLVAGLSVLVALVHAVREREADLALMRLLGATPRRVAALVVVEALWLAWLGTALGLLLGYGATQALAWMLQDQRSLALTGWWPSPALMAVPALAALAACAGAALPIRRALRTDVMQLLQNPR